MDTLWREIAQVMDGYTLSVRGAVLGKFRDVYFMRSAISRKELKVDETDQQTLYEEWLRFQAETLGSGAQLTQPEARIVETIS
jgi:hypothetical protein